jgi:hypothetical protein
MLDYYFDLSKEDVFLDLGVGTGALANQFSERGYTIDGLDCKDREGPKLRNYFHQQVPQGNWVGWPLGNQKPMLKLCSSYDYIISNPPFKLLDDFIFYAQQAKKGCIIIAPYKQLLKSKTKWTHIFTTEFYRSCFGVFTPICIAVWDRKSNKAVEPPKRRKYPPFYVPFVKEQKYGVTISKFLSFNSCSLFLHTKGFYNWIRKVTPDNPHKEMMFYQVGGSRHKKGDPMDHCCIPCNSEDEVNQIYASYLRYQEEIAKVMEFYPITKTFCLFKGPQKPDLTTEEVLPGAFLVKRNADTVVVKDWLSTYTVAFHNGDSIPVSKLDFNKIDILVWNGLEIVKSIITNAFFYFRTITDNLSWDVMGDFLHHVSRRKDNGHLEHWKSILLQD